VRESTKCGCDGWALLNPAKFAHPAGKD